MRGLRCRLQCAIPVFSEIATEDFAGTRSALYAFF